MYAESRIAQSLAGFKARYGWMPEYHSVDEVDHGNKILSTTFDVEANNDITMKRDLTPKESRWIMNERALCWADSSYFETRYAYLCDETNNIFRFQNRKSQSLFDDIIAEFDERQVAIEIIALKGRQLGVSTKVALKFLHRLLFVPNTQAIMGSVNDEKSELLTRIMATCVDRMPWWLVPEIKKNRQGTMLEFHTGSILSIQSGSQKTGVGQGWTPVLVHISECGDYPNPKKTLEEGLMRATHPSAALFAVYEGTGNGSTGWWPDSWRTAKELHPQGRSRLCPMFLPWHTAPDLYPRFDWLKKFPIPYEWQPAQETIAHAKKCEAYVHNTPMLSKRMGDDWRLPIEQRWYWEFNYIEARHKHCEKIWLQQMPADDREALVGKNDVVFDPETIEVISQEREKDYAVYAIVGEGIDDRHHPKDEEINYDEPRVTVSFDSPRGDTYEWLLVPLKPINEHEESTAMTKLLIFEEPLPGADYGMGCDIAGGIGQDRTVIGIARTGRGEMPDTQAAEFCSDTVGSVEIAFFAACIAALYGRDVPGWGMPKICIEQVRKYGDECQLQMKKMGFHRQHKMIRYDGKNIQESKSNKDGWYTHSWSRPLLLGRFIDAVNNGWYKVNSPFLIRELGDFEQKYTAEGKSKMEHQSGKHDDRIFGNGLGFFTQHHVEAMADRWKKRYNAPKSALPQIDMGWYDANEFSVSGSRERL